MNLLHLTVRTTIALIVLAGCSGTQSTPGVPSTSLFRQSYIAPAGSFTGAYSGTYTQKRTGNCYGPPLDCTTTNKLSGRGKASFILDSTESGTMVTVVAAGHEITNGAITLTSESDPENSVTMKVTSGLPGHLNYTVTGGTGKFLGASGNGTYAISYVAPWKYNDTYSGTFTL